MMRHSWMLFLAVSVLVPLSLRAAGRDEALAVIDRAIRAHGGEGALTKTRFIHRTGKGQLILFGKENPFTAETVMQLPDHFRDVAEVDLGGQKNHMVTVLNGDHGWMSLSGTTSELEKERLTELREEGQVMWASTLLPLKDKDLTLELSSINHLGKPAEAVKVAGKDRPEMTLIFDKSSGLLVKIERPTKLGGAPLKKEYLFADHKEFEGVKLPTRWLELVNGNKLIDLTLTGYDFPRQVQESTFARP